ncbi:MAG: protein-tyrosine phosphatase family protein, partial [Bacteroidota bacterium]
NITRQKMRIYWIDEFDKGKLGIMPRPRGNEWLEDEIKKLSLRGIHELISLLEKSEASELELEKEAELCTKYEIGFQNFPIKDRSIPDDTTAFLDLVDKISQLLLADKKLVIHCRMGIGRASLLAAGVLAKKGIEPSKVFQLISSYRQMEVPDTEEQIRWFEKIMKA